ncbi:MAG: hypothetical protein Q4G14_12575 [Paracoccus sp. (in: a-proteobacteria)]|uniref:hypothetical protein n=1 Tax=Paracoccus sp. TaxID=267 RepID=UPI0026E00295|nr:hypothetical protein [Paracoccus sp. (in: a-proteobacteria)]MDO5614059.1 hypothetical protein [Paracoccus sp. (in: a-proteobacteria)]
MLHLLACRCFFFARTGKPRRHRDAPVAYDHSCTLGAVLLPITIFSRSRNRRQSNYSRILRGNRLISCDFHPDIRLHQAALDGRNCAKTAAKG